MALTPAVRADGGHGSAAKDMTEELLIRREGRLLVLTFNRPDSLNAITREMFERLGETLASAAADSAIGAVVLTGAGRGFSSGGDRKRKAEDLAREALLPVEQRTRPQTFEASVAEMRGWARSVELLHAMPKPTIAMINGACAGAGLSLAAACDLRFSSRSAVYASAFAAAGVSGDFGGSWFWTRILGPAKARELYLLAERMSADEALAFGLVHRVFADADLAGQTMVVAERLAGRAPHVAGYIKENLNLALDASLAHALDVETRNMLLSGRTWLVEEPKPPAG
jgi:2-(1,2-epoxy-1,2-dihydrophenyl)acetyl-CoA isomerase